MRRRAFGFTLIELMIAMALAGLVVAGALQLHASFGKQTERQSEVAEMQQNLRVSMLILERAIRNAGYGIPGGMLPESSSNPPSCNNNVKRFHYGFEWSNSNTFTDPMTVVTWAAKPATATDVDPDYFWVMYADATTSPTTTPIYAADDNLAGLTTMTTATTTAQMTNFGVHDLFVIQFPTNSTCPSGLCSLLTLPVESTGDLSDSSSHCIREITAVSSGGTVKTLTHNLSSASYCFNAPVSSDPCAAGIHSLAPVTLRHLEPAVTAYRVMTTSDANNNFTGATPKLTYRYAPMNTGYNANWNVIAENIDDMQIAVITKAGLVCNQANDPSYNPIDANSCDITTAQAVRITLVARSSSKAEGVTVDTTPLVEDRVSANDPTVVGYLHRSLTAEIELRNMGTDATQ